MEIIGEINTGHSGHLEDALVAVRAAYDAGADAIKFQSWKPESLYSSQYLEENRIAKRMFDRLSLSYDDFRAIREECQAVGIKFSSTPYTVAEVEELHNLGADFIKVASMDIDNTPLLNAIAATKRPVVISTGMASLDEIDLALDALSSSEVSVLHCTSIYPSTDTDVHLATVGELATRYSENRIGFSDHTTHVWTGAVAVASGAEVLEKHFTLNREKFGFDNQMALSAEQLAEYVRISRSAKEQLGKIDFNSRPDSGSVADLRRSAHLIKDVYQGEPVREDDVGFFRPGVGLKRREISFAEDTRWSRDLQAGTILNLEDIETNV